jgi:hypothetical protein
MRRTRYEGLELWKRFLKTTGWRIKCWKGSCSSSFCYDLKEIHSVQFFTTSSELNDLVGLTQLCLTRARHWQAHLRPVPLLPHSFLAFPSWYTALPHPEPVLRRQHSSNPVSPRCRGRMKLAILCSIQNSNYLRTGVKMFHWVSMPTKRRWTISLEDRPRLLFGNRSSSRYDQHTILRVYKTGCMNAQKERKSGCKKLI